MLAAMRAPLNDQRHGCALKLHRPAKSGEVSKAPHAPVPPANPPLLETGMALAISYLRLGEAALSPAIPGRGGAHNHATRESHALTASQIANLRAATRHAAAIGLPFTRMITIHWEAAGVALEAMVAATGRFVDLLSKMLSRHGCRATWLWVHENGDNKGGHCHLLAHVPPALVARLTRLQRGWLRRITGRSYRARVICSRPIGGLLGIEMTNAALHAANLEAALAYVLKGACPAAAKIHHLERVEAGGRIIGKRCGTSQNIGVLARKLETTA